MRGLPLITRRETLIEESWAAMRENELSDPLRDAAGILSQLLKYTLQIARSGNGAEVDVTALIGACERRLPALRDALERAGKEYPRRCGQDKGGADEEARVQEMTRSLHGQVLACKKLLEARRDQTAAAAARLRRTMQALRAYSKAR